MNGSNGGMPATSAIVAVLDALGLNGAQFAVHDLPGTYSNFTHLVAAEGRDGRARNIVIRRYNPANYDEGHVKHRCEYHALQLLTAQGLPVPPPLLLDADGALLGLPGIVTEYVPGAPIELPAEAKRWGRMAAKAARMLARIHQTPFSETDQRYLMNDDVEVAWFLKGGRVPDYMRADPDGEVVWHMLNDRWGSWAPVSSASPIPITGRAISSGAAMRSRRCWIGKKPATGIPRLMWLTRVWAIASRASRKRPMSFCGCMSRRPAGRCRGETWRCLNWPPVPAP